MLRASSAATAVLLAQDSNMFGAITIQIIKKSSIDNTIISIYCYLCLVIVDSISFWSGTIKPAQSPKTDDT